jgi:outer membrane protein assembly factor BamB
LIFLAVISTLLAAQAIAPSPSILCSPPPKGPSTNWTQYQFDPCHTGYNPYEFILNASNVGNLVVNWSQYIGVVGPYLLPPTVVNGIAYLATATMGTGQNALYAFDASSGKRLWQFSPHDSYLTTPAVANGIVYTGSSDALYALDAATGAPVWALPAKYASAPAIVDGVVYDSWLQTSGAATYALDARTGATIWKHSFGAGGPYLTALSAAAVANGIAYVAFGTDEGVGAYNVFALNAATGELLWAQTVGKTGTYINPTVANSVVYLPSEDGNLYAFNAFNGALIWKQPYSSYSIAVANGLVYAETYAYTYAIHASDGTLAWKFPIENNNRGVPVVANGVVYVPGTPDLVALDAGTGARLWLYTTTCSAGPLTVVNGTLYEATIGMVAGNHLPYGDCASLLAFRLPK